MWTHSTFAAANIRSPAPQGKGKRQPVGKEMAAYAVLRIQKLKSWGDIAGADVHNFRERETPNADEERTQDNATFIGKAEQDSVEAIKAAIGEQKICAGSTRTFFEGARRKQRRPGRPAGGCDTEYCRQQPDYDRRREI